MLSLVIRRTIRIVAIIFLFLLSNGSERVAVMESKDDTSGAVTIIQIICIGIACWLVW